MQIFGINLYGVYDGETDVYTAELDILDSIDRLALIAVTKDSNSTSVEIVKSGINGSTAAMSFIVNKSASGISITPLSTISGIINIED